MSHNSKQYKVELVESPLVPINISTSLYYGSGSKAITSSFSLLLYTLPDFILLSLTSIYSLISYQMSQHDTMEQLQFLIRQQAY